MCRWPYWPYPAHDASTHGAGILNQYRQLAQERNETTKQRKSKACAERKTESTMLPQQQCRRAGGRHWPKPRARIPNENRLLAQSETKTTTLLQQQRRRVGGHTGPTLLSTHGLLSTRGACILKEYQQLAQERDETTTQRKSTACAERKTKSLKPTAA